jgi:hypothetical protein
MKIFGCISARLTRQLISDIGCQSQQVLKQKAKAVRSLAIVCPDMAIQSVGETTKLATLIMHIY